MTSTSTAAARRKQRAAQGTISTTLLGAMVSEVDAHETRLRAVEHALAPAFSPRREETDVTSTRGPGAHPAEPVVMRQASTALSGWGPMHDPRVERAFGTDMYPKVLAAVEAEYAEQAARREPSPVLYQSRAWCGRNGCRPATPCLSCQGHRVAVRDDARAPVQVSTPWPGQQAPGPEPEPAPVRWDELPERAPSEPGFAQARARAPQVPGHTGEVIQGPGGS